MVPIQRFEVLGLFGDRDISIDFPNDVAILVDPNGSGKTTVLRIIALTLLQQWKRLVDIQFERLHLTFGDGAVLNLSRTDCEKRLTTASVFWQTVKQLTDFEKDALISASHTHRRDHPVVRKLSKITGYPTSFVIRRVTESPWQKNLFEVSDDPFAEYSSLLSASFALDTIYFPTYRRVEAALVDEGDEAIWDDLSIHYGMNDVAKRIDHITSEIKSSFVESYSKTSGQIVSQLIDGIHLGEKEFETLRDTQNVRIVLERIGDNISATDKSKLIHLVKSADIRDRRYEPLVYFISNLMSVYEQQREKDEAIKRFVVLVNSYLGDKQFTYNESSVNLSVRNTRNDAKVELQQLSSGEKQIVSIFSRLHMAERKPCAVFFDEPELSLSIEWQRMLLDHIYASESCKFLLAATHSPFIYDNSLDRFATVLKTDFRRKANDAPK